MNDALKKCFLIISIASYIVTDGQNVRKMILGVAYQTNIVKHNVNLNFNYEFTVKTRYDSKLIEVGAGTEYFLCRDFLIDTKLSYGLKYINVCHLKWTEKFTTWFVAAHYKFSETFKKQYACPEIGINFNRNLYYRITPSIQYYFDVRMPQNITNSIYLAVKLSFVISKYKFRN